MKLTVKLKNSASCGVTGTMMKVSQTPARVRNVIKTPLGTHSQKDWTFFGNLWSSVEGAVEDAGICPSCDQVGASVS